MNILTFDIEEWYVYKLFPKGGESYYLPIINYYLDEILDLLEGKGITATFFCVGIMGREHPEVIKKIFSRGHEIGFHSDKHKLIYHQSVKEFREDTRKGLDSLEQVIGEKVTYYRAPAFSITPKNMWALEILSQNGIEIDSSIIPIQSRKGGWGGFPSSEPLYLKFENGNVLKEFPINCHKKLFMNIMYSGGGYFRFLPYKYISKWISESQYNMTYFHIRDFDAKQKKVRSVISPKYFFAYYGIKDSFDKFKKMINDFEFISLGQANHIYNWNEAQEIDINFLKSRK